MHTCEKILVCDVDGVVVDLSYQWFEYLKGIVKDVSLSYEDLAHSYDFHGAVSKYITQQEAYYFWKQSGLYDGREPLQNASEALWSLKNDHGFSIVFASHVEGNHAKSKFEFLKKHFPVDGFLATREKHFVRACVAIDDRVDHLVNHPMNVGRILKYTPHEQTYKGDFKPDAVVYEWSEQAVQTILNVYERKHVVYR
jgi:5'(3')-deoxyribonucleotidase